MLIKPWVFEGFLFCFSFSFLAICKSWKNRNRWLSLSALSHQSKHSSPTYNFTLAKLFSFFNGILHFLISFILFLWPKMTSLLSSLIKRHQRPHFIEIFAYPMFSYTYKFLECFAYTTVMKFFTHNFALLFVMILKICPQFLWYSLSQKVQLISAPLEQELDLLYSSD